jgi:xanthine dehydrogenase accessory factor
MRQEPALPRNTEPSPPADAAAPEDLGGQRALVCATRELLRRGHSVVLCLVVLTRGSTYRKAGALAASVASDGTQRGAVSGGCLESGLAVAARRVLRTEAAEIVVFDTRSDDDLIFGSGSGCRGQTSVLLVPMLAGTASPVLTALERADERRRPLTVAVAIDGPSRGQGWCWLESEAIPIGTGPRELLSLSDRPGGEHALAIAGTPVACAVATVRPSPRVILIGAGPELPALIRIGRGMGWYMIVIDHRAAAVSAYAARADRSIVARPSEGLARLTGEPDDAVVVMTHTAANDLDALTALSERPERYIGLLGPPARRDELLGQMDPATRAALAERLRSPVGLKLGGNGPEMLALSIAAELQQFLTTQR